MALFGKKKEQVALQEKLESKLSIELELNNKATDKQVAKSKQVVKEFNKIISENGFTIVIRGAAGGKR